MVHGRPQHKGKQTGTIAAPERPPDLLFSSASYLYFPFSLLMAPCNMKNTLVTATVSTSTMTTYVMFLLLTQGGLDWTGLEKVGNLRSQ